MTDRANLTAGALFSGIGGFCLGCEASGIRTSWAIENDAEAVKTYLANVKGTRVVTKNEKPESILDVAVATHDLEPVDILHAGFPCQSFSQAGDRKGFSDPRGQLFYEITRIVKEFKDKKPSVLVFENSPHLRHGEGGSWFIELAKEVKKAGYWFRNTNCAEMNTFDLTSLPQRRNRLFMVAFSIAHFKNGKFQFPNKKDNTPKDLVEFIDFSGSIDDDTYYLPDENRYYKMINKKVDEKPRLYQLRKYVVRVQEPGVCPTLTANMGAGGHNVPFVKDAKGIRKLTEYECLRLQGFPLTFIFPEDVPRAKRYMQVGNSVSVPVIEQLSVNIREKIIKERK